VLHRSTAAARGVASCAESQDNEVGHWFWCRLPGTIVLSDACRPVVSPVFLEIVCVCVCDLVGTQSVLLAKKVFAKFSLGDSLGVTRPAAESAWNTAAFGAGLGAGVTNALTQRQLPYYPHAPGQFGVDPLTGSPYPPSVGIPAANYAAPTPIPASQLAVVGAPAVSSASAGPVAPSVPSVPQSAPQTSENNGVSDHAPPTKPE
jgi:hypothetical protein